MTADAVPTTATDTSHFLSRNFVGYLRSPQELGAYNQFTSRPPGPQGVLAGHAHYHRAYQGMALAAGGGKDKAAAKLQEALKNPDKHPQMAAELAEVKKRLEAAGIKDVNDPKALEKLKTWVSDNKVGPASMALKKLVQPEYDAWMKAVADKTPGLKADDPAAFHAAVAKHAKPVAPAQPAPQ